ncbi:MAG: hypothetical protein JWO82_2905 [Akkermansiaceae bacterium]|nr:hypothetical protein [Akkermansiaceae bacterium]
MNPPDPRSSGLPAATRALRFSCQPETILQEISTGSSTYVHARNLACELAAIAPLHSPVIDEQERLAFFPESGLSFALGEVTGLHAVMIPRPSAPAYSLEIGLPGVSRALSLVAIPECSDMLAFENALLRQNALPITEKELSAWQAVTTASLEMCPCCTASAEARQKEPEKHPLARVLRHATRERHSLLCRLISPHLAFSSWITPEQFRAGNGRLSAVDTGRRGLLEIHIGYVHSLWTLRQKIDGEDYVVLRVFDPLGRLHLEIASPELRLEAVWRELCREREF